MLPLSGALSGAASDPPADPEIPNSRSPDSRFGRETGRESPIPDSAGTGNRAQIPRFPIRPGPGLERGPRTGNRGPAGGTPGISWSGRRLG